MSIRKDEAQLIITIDAKESQAYQESLVRTKSLVAELRKLKPGTEEYNKALQESLDLSRKLSSADFSKLSVSQLGQRKKALEDLRKIIPQVTFAENGFEKELQQVNQALSENAARTKAVSNILGQKTSFLSRLKVGILSVAAGYATWEAAKAVVTGLFTRVVELTVAQQKYSAMLKTALGSQKASDDAMKLIRDTAKETVFGIDELTESYVKFANRGIVLTKQEILSLSDLAASQGKSFDQLTEAILDAQTGEFERLKEFGIRGSKSGDQATLSFKGFNQTVALTPQAMRDALVSMGKIDGIAGANAEQMTTLSGQWSNFNDTLDQLGTGIGSKLAPVLGRLLGQASSWASAVKEWISPTKTAREETFALQKEFNSEIGVLKRLRPEAEGRKELIQQINEKYKDYLPNLLSENASLKEIEQAQKLANKAFKEKIIFLAFEESYKAQIDKTKEAVKNLAAVELSRARNAQDNQDFAALGATPAQIEQQKKINDNFVNTQETFSKSVVENSEKAAADIEKTYNKLFKEVDSSIEKAQARFGQRIDAPVIAAPSTTADDAKEADKKFKEQYEKLQNEYAQKQHLLEVSLKKNEITESQYQESKLQLQKEGFEAEMNFLTQNGKVTTDEYRKAQIGLLDVQIEFQNSKLKAIEEYAENLLAEEEKRYLQGKISEEQYELVKLNIKRGSILAQMAELKKQGRGESDLYKEKETELLKTQKEIFDKIVINAKDFTEKQKKELEKRLQDLTTSASQELLEIDRQELNKTLTLKEANEQRRKIQIEAYQAQLDLLKAAGLEFTEEYIKIEKAMTEEQKKGNSEREGGWRQILKDAIPFAQAIADGIFDLEKQNTEQSKNDKIAALEDEYNRKYKLAEGNAQQEEILKKQFENKKRAIEKEAFEKNKRTQIAQALVNGAVAAIQSLANTTLPFPASLIGPALIAVQTGFQIARINAQKFNKGGRILPKLIGSQRISTNPNIPTQSGGDNVLAMVKPGEVVLNEEHQARAGGPAFFRALGVPGFNTGGLISPRPITLPNTSPAAFAGTIAPSSNVVQTDPAVMELANSVRALAEMMPEALSNIQANVNYFDVAEKASDLATIQRLASY